jgi:hypothetical protein
MKFVAHLTVPGELPVAAVTCDVGNGHVNATGCRLKRYGANYSRTRYYRLRSYSWPAHRVTIRWAP